ncbi:MAG: tRNA (adenosine(37)-N6)-threonylcarbamoyltransferase complex transferase subunit TsaD [Bacilli bacterium]|jgi:N6-L-threonylcarbamoyladenine synthase
MKILAIETSCDETACAVIEDGRSILSSVINTQIPIHTRYGGVVPEIASRNHVMDLPYVIDEALEKAQMELADVDAIAVTRGPGLVGALLVGVSQAKAMAAVLDKPLIGVHHIEGHIAANYLQHPELKPPFLCLVVSGGHSHLVYVRDYTDFEIIGRTRDDAAGEAFDKVARVLGLGYPGGPKIDAAARNGNPHAVEFPRVTLEKDSYDFSFSGLKSAVLNYLNSKKQKGEEVDRDDIAASFQQAVTDVLVEKTIRCALEKKIDKVVIAGGVSANSELREELAKACEKNGLTFYYPDPVLCTDNAAMIGSQAYYDYLAGERADERLDAKPGLKIGDAHHETPAQQ